MVQSWAILQAGFLITTSSFFSSNVNCSGLLSPEIYAERYLYSPTVDDCERQCNTSQISQLKTLWWMEILNKGYYKHNQSGVLMAGVGGIGKINKQNTYTDRRELTDPPNKQMN